MADFIGDVNAIPCEADAAGQVRIAGESEPLPYAAPATGADLVLMVRPEDVVIDPAGPDCTRMQVTVEHRVFAGSATRLFVRSAGGHQIVVQISGLVKAADRPVGSVINVGWANEAGRLLAV